LDTGNNIQNLVSKDEEPRVKKRSAWAAFFFTLLCPGLGHFYCGEIKRGFIIFLISTITTVVFYIPLKFAPDITFFYIGLIVSLTISIFFFIDAVKIARRKKGYILQNFNKAKYYIAIIITYFYYMSPFEDIITPETFGTPSGSMMNTIIPGDKFLTNDLAYGIKNPFSGKYSILYSSPKRGDIVNYKYHGLPGEAPPKEKTNYLKRILGLPGDSLLIRRGFVYINGKIYEPPVTSILTGAIKYEPDYADKMIFPKGFKWNVDYYGPIKIPKSDENVNFDTSDIKLWSKIIEDEGNKLEIIKNRIFINDVEKYSYTFKNNYYFMIGDYWYNSLDSRFWGFAKEDDIVSQITMILFSWDTNIPLKDFNRRINSIRWDRIGKMIE
jgi:signal peptidase I